MQQIALDSASIRALIREDVRTCSQPGCTAILSRYNPSDVCHAHQRRQIKLKVQVPAVKSEVVAKACFRGERRRVATKRARGICIRCMKPAVPMSTYCEYHREFSRLRYWKRIGKPAPPRREVKAAA